MNLEEMHFATRNQLIAALEACGAEKCSQCPLSDADSCATGLLKLAAETIRGIDGETAKIKEQRDYYHKEYLRQTVEAEYQEHRADILHGQLQRVFDMYVDAVIDVETVERKERDNDTGTD